MIDHELCAIDGGTRHNSGPRAKIDLCGETLSFLVDTGAPINVINEYTFNALAHPPRLDVCNGNFYGVGSNKPIEVLGQFTTSITFNGRSTKAGFIVIRGTSRSLLCFASATKLGIVSICKEASVDEHVDGAIASLNASPTPRLSLDELKAAFPSAFSVKLGCVKGHVVRLELKPSGRSDKVYGRSPSTCETRFGVRIDPLGRRKVNIAIKLNKIS